MSCSTVLVLRWSAKRLVRAGGFDGEHVRLGKYLFVEHDLKYAVMTAGQHAVVLAQRRADRYSRFSLFSGLVGISNVTEVKMGVSRRIAALTLAAVALPTAMAVACPPALALSPAATRLTARVVASATAVAHRRPLLGIDLYSLSNYRAALVSADAQRTLKYIKSSLHASAVGISWNFYDTTYTSDVVQATSKTLTPANLAIVTKIAQGLGLRVEYRPQIVVTQEPNSWQGIITPANPRAWFNSYFNVEKPYLLLAQQLGIAEFVTANEMHRMNSTPGWGAFFARARGVYHGIVSYTAWDEDYLPSAAHLLPVRYPGTNMYRPLFLPDNAPLARVTAAWEAYFRRVPASVLARTAIDETGIAARHGAYRHPGNTGPNDGRDEAVQVNWYLAACHTVLRFHMRAVYIWKVDLTDNPAHPAKSLSTFEGQKGAAAIRTCAHLLAG
jgi:Glycoside Hydrolase Family 113